LAAATVEGLQWELDHFKISRKLLTLGKESQGQVNLAHQA
jgi:hypothetical protein